MLIFCSWHAGGFDDSFLTVLTSFTGLALGQKHDTSHESWGQFISGRQKIADTNMTLQPESSKQITWCTIRGWCRWQRCSCGFWCLPWPAVWRCRAGLALSMAEEEGSQGHHTQDCRWSWSNHRHHAQAALKTRERNSVSQCSQFAGFYPLLISTVSLQSSSGRRYLIYSYGTRPSSF